MWFERQIRSILSNSFFSVTVAASCCVPCVCRAQDSQKIEDIKPVGPENLGFFAEKVRRHEPVTLAYIGGSITAGCGASQYANNYYWRSRTVLLDEIRKRGSSGNSLNAAIGGTGSSYGAFRIGAQLLNHNPDLLIVEFAVNDCPGKPEQAFARKKEMMDGMEGIVRQTLKQNPKCGIVFLYTSTATFQEQYYAKGLVSPAIEAHHSVARHYGITEVITGPLIEKGLQDGAFTLKSFFPDGVHPSDIGHDLYSKALVAAILPGLDQPTPATVKETPQLLGSGHYEYARLDPIPGASDGWSKVKKGWSNWPADVEKLVCDTAGKPLSFIPKGREVQLIFQGQLEIKWTADGKEHSAKLKGNGPTMPMPGNWSLPANSEGTTFTVEAVAGADGKVHGELMGLFSIQAMQK